MNSSTIVNDVHHPLYTYIFRKGHVSKIKNRNFRKKSPPLKIYVSIVNCNICSWVMCGVPLCASISLYAEYSKLWHLTFIAHSDFVLPVNTNIPRYFFVSFFVFVCIFFNICCCISLKWLAGHLGTGPGVDGRGRRHHRRCFLQHNLTSSAFSINIWIVLLCLLPF